MLLLQLVLQYNAKIRGHVCCHSAHIVVEVARGVPKSINLLLDIAWKPFLKFEKLFSDCWACSSNESTEGSSSLERLTIVLCLGELT